MVSSVVQESNTLSDIAMHTWVHCRCLFTSVSWHALEVDIWVMHWRTACPCRHPAYREIYWAQYKDRLCDIIFLQSGPSECWPMVATGKAHLTLYWLLSSWQLHVKIINHLISCSPCQPIRITAKDNEARIYFLYFALKCPGALYPCLRGFVFRVHVGLYPRDINMLDLNERLIPVWTLRFNTSHYRLRNLRDSSEHIVYGDDLLQLSIHLDLVSMFISIS